MLVVNRFIRGAEFFPHIMLINALNTLKIFSNEVLFFHGLSEEIIFDKGPQFVSSFLTHFLINLNINTCHSSAFYPQSYGKTK